MLSKNIILQTAFSAILPTDLTLLYPVIKEIYQFFYCCVSFVGAEYQRQNHGRSRPPQSGRRRYRQEPDSTHVRINSRAEEI